MLTTKVIPILLIISIGFIKAQDDPYRLPPNYIIKHYDIDLNVPAESFSADVDDYSGSVEIQFQVTEETSEVKLHSSYNNIELLTIQLNDDTPDSYSVDNVTDILTLRFDSTLTVGQDYILKITFNAHLLWGGGFYKVSYTDHNNETQYLATTQFQATNARNAFPCFDEPGYKSTFAFILTYPSDMNALTNTPALQNSTDEDNHVTTTQFGTTPSMSVYLVAFTISKYTCSEADLEGATKHRVCSRLDKEEARTWALDVTSKVIEHLSSYTGITYTKSLSKLDQVAVPGKGGAMENWGLVIYGETALLFDNKIQTNLNKQSIAGIISHELSHQWFGNLVTCKWWSETFLNEGFATVFQYYTTHYVVPEFQMEKQFVIRVVQPILITEGNLNVPALRSNASTPSQVSAKFNSYSYSKGGSVLRMIEHILGRDLFKEGVKMYLEDNSYQPVEPQNLWDALETVIENAVTVNLPTSVPLSDVVDNWINKGGFPVLNVSLDGTIITISQQRFLYSGTDNESSSWYVPVSYSTAAIGDHNENTAPRGWVTPTANYVITDFTNSSQWIVVNNQQTGFYRVNYDATLWTNLATALKQTNSSGIHASNRAQIVDDSHHLARAGYLTFGKVMEIVEFLENELEFFPWYPGVNLFSFLLGRTGSTTILGTALADHFLKLLRAPAETVLLGDVNEDNQLFTLTQVMINTYACKYGNTACITAAKQLFATYRSTFERPNINTRSIVYCNAIRYSENPAEDWDFLYEQYLNASVSDDSSIIWTALGCAINTPVLNSFLGKILTDDEVIRPSQYTSIFSTIYNGNEIGVDVALQFFINNHQALSDAYSAAELNVGSILTGLGSVFTTIAQIERLENFLNSTDNLNENITKAGNEASATARSNQEIVNDHKLALYEYFGLTDEETETSTSTSASTSTPTTTTTSTTTTTTAATTTEGPGGASTFEKMGIAALILIALINMLYDANL